MNITQNANIKPCISTTHDWDPPTESIMPMSNFHTDNSCLLSRHLYSEVNADNRNGRNKNCRNEWKTEDENILSETNNHDA